MYKTSIFALLMLSFSVTSVAHAAELDVPALSTLPPLPVVPSFEPTDNEPKPEPKPKPKPKPQPKPQPGEAKEVTIQAERAGGGNNFSVEKGDPALNDKYLHATKDHLGKPQGKDKSYTFAVPKGSYDIWIRARKAQSQKSGSFWGKVNNEPWSQWSIGREDGWKWYKVESMHLSQGSHTISLAAREQGSNIDAFVITSKGHLLSNKDRNGEKKKDVKGNKKPKDQDNASKEEKKNSINSDNNTPKASDNKSDNSKAKKVNGKKDSDKSSKKSTQPSKKESKEKVKSDNKKDNKPKPASKKPSDKPKQKKK